VVCVCFFSTCLSACVASAALFVCVFVFLTTFLFSSLAKIISLVQCSCYTHNPAHMSVLLFYLHVDYSNGCVCVPEHLYAFPSSWIFLHIIALFICTLCVMFYIYTHLVVYFFFFRNLIDTRVTVSIHVLIPLFLN